MEIPQKTRVHLEWDKILNQLAQHCRGPVAARQALSLDIPEADERQARLACCSEARALLDRGHSPPLGLPADVQRAVALARRGGILEGEELQQIGVHLETAARVRRYLGDFIDEAPHLIAIAERLADLPHLARDLLDSFDERGELADSASGELGDLRLRVASLHEGLKARVDSLVRDPEYAGLLQDDFFTIREDRYVLPVKSGHKNHVAGIVHGWSGSGATVYIEPQPVVEANNHLRLAQADIDKEIRRILKRLSQRVGEESEAIRRSMQALDELDFAVATGRLSRELECSAPIIEEGGLRLKAARHPLLLLDGIKVVANDIILSDEQRGLVITGPNTGGKTVALKTAGLCTLMALSGLHIPADEGSSVPPTPGVFTDIGDEQSLSESHSTFSGHIANIKAILAKVKPGSLVLLDELVVGTDPLQGAALAQAILEAFVDIGAFILVTTHYQSLKALPFNDDRFRNGAVGFDAERHAPTYKLRLDIPGASSALQTARRLGLAMEIVERAAALAGPEQRQLEQVILRLEQEAATLEAERRALASQRRKLEVAVTAAEAHEARLKQRLKDGLERERSQALLEARQLREELRRIKKTIKAQRKEEMGAEAVSRQGAAVDKVVSVITQQQAAERAEAAGPPIDAAQLKLGQAVFVVSLDTTAELVALPDSRGRCEVRAGIMTLKVKADDLRYGAAQQREAKRPQSAPKKAAEVTWETAQPQVPDNTVDVRGMRTEEAIEKIEAFFDEQYGRERNAAYVIHGHGTGTLKRMLRGWLPKSQYVRDTRPGLAHEGGDGVTAVLLS
ncbi:endonuclease MutS2 [Myxococcota bacterium]|nr:endonuclease MutS2 [Myxococcota bacterium]MBU1431574.1 endonuclease MutS2 [Myxococcota bacterium]MBU1897375.1 endonuclease MutS2 [Myxococcota bacterium]